MRTYVDHVAASRFGLLVYGGGNLGDEVQSLAALRHLPRVDATINRDAPASLAEPTRVIFNGWFTHRPDLWPPIGRNIIPLLVSVHLSDEGGSSHDQLLSPESRDFLQEHGPVGCRDITTLELLRSHDVPAYFSGCLTLTFPPNERPRHDRIVLVDVSPSDVKVPVELTDRVIHVGQSTSARRGFRLTRRLNLEPIHRFATAYHLLRLYATSRLVVTTRLHAALPALALGTPAVLLMRDPEDPRFRGLSSFPHSIPLAEAIDDPSAIPWEEGCAPKRHQPLAEHLTDRCDRFVANHD